MLAENFKEFCHSKKIRAITFTGTTDNLIEIESFLNETDTQECFFKEGLIIVDDMWRPPYLLICKQSGELIRINCGDIIIKDENGKIYPLKLEGFYEKFIKNQKCST